MKSTMQDIPLSVARIVRYGATVYGDTSVTTWTPAGPEVTTFSAIAGRAAACAHALRTTCEIDADQRIGTFMDNGSEHLEIFFAAACMGAVFSPLNSHLSDDQLIHIINITAQPVIFCAPWKAAHLARLIPHCPSVQRVVVAAGNDHAVEEARHDICSMLLTQGIEGVLASQSGCIPVGIDDPRPEPAPARGDIHDDTGEVPSVLHPINDTDAIIEAAGETPVGPRVVEVYAYEELLDGRSTEFPWPDLPEDEAAAMCFSTGTEGAPKGVAYSQRSMFLHSQNLRAVDSFALNDGAPFLCCVPIYHVLSWGVPLAAFAAGAPLIFPGQDLSAPRLAEIIQTSMPRMAHGVPTLWVSLIQYYLEHPPTRMSLQEIFAGGAPVPPMLIKLWEEHFGVDVIHCWGMTETSPVGTVSRPPAGISGETRFAYRISQGRFPVSMEYRIVDDKGQVLEGHDRNQGEIQVRGNWVTGRYYHSPTSAPGGAAHMFRGEVVENAEDRFTADGWFRTGDVGHVNRDGFLTVNDRMRDIIRSGGEWIYSAELENLVVDSPVVAECAVIGYPDDTWGERPLAVTVLVEGIPRDRETAERLRDRLRAYIPGWMLPEYWAFVDEIDKTSVDKYDKKDLRQHVADGQLEIIALKGPTRSTAPKE